MTARSRYDCQTSRHVCTLSSCTDISRMWMFWSSAATWKVEGRAVKMWSKSLSDCELYSSTVNVILTGSWYCCDVDLKVMHLLLDQWKNWTHASSAWHYAGDPVTNFQDPSSVFCAWHDLIFVDVLVDDEREMLSMTKTLDSMSTDRVQRSEFSCSYLYSSVTVSIITFTCLSFFYSV